MVDAHCTELDAEKSLGVLFEVALQEVACCGTDTLTKGILLGLHDLLIGVKIRVIFDGAKVEICERLENTFRICSLIEESEELLYGRTDVDNLLWEDDRFRAPGENTGEDGGCENQPYRHGNPCGRVRNDAQYGGEHTEHEDGKDETLQEVENKFHCLMI